MLQVNSIRQNKEKVLKGLELKHFSSLHLVDEVLAQDDERRRLTLGYDETKAAINRLSDQIRDLSTQGNKEAAAEKKAESARLKESLNAFSTELATSEKKLHDSLVQIPNLPHSLVPPGNSPADNTLVRESGTTPSLGANALPHWKLAKKYNLIDFEMGAKITGSGFPVYVDRGARLQRALIRYFLDYNTARGYREYQPPLLVNAETAFGTGQLPDKEGQMYYVDEDKFYLVPTAEVPLTNIYRDKILSAEDLPLKMTAYTPCFRREAGSYGKDVKGLNRLHQFDKVEIVQLTHPDHSEAALDEMVSHVEGLLKELQLPYRLLRLCGGDMSFASAMTYDFEVWSAAQQKWLEVSSVSLFDTFQSNRMKIRFKQVDGKGRLVHTLNGSSLALPRILASLLENNQGPEGIRLPSVLENYFGPVLLQ